MDKTELLRALVESGASDLHCKAGSAPALRIGGELVRHGDTAFRAEDVALIAQELLTAEQQKTLLHTGSVVGAHSASGLGRFRVAAFRQRGSVALVIHAVADEILRLDDLGLPSAAVSLAEGESGLVLVASPVGNGATTTLAALVDHVNSHRRVHIVTVDDPIEVLHRDAEAVVSQLEVGSDVPTLADGIRAASKIDADVVAVSDLSDRASAQAALDAVSRGRLVFATIGGDTALTAVHSFLELFSIDERPIVLDAFARAVNGILAQRLLRDDRGELVAAVESLVKTAKVEHCLADPLRFPELQSHMEEGTYHGMQTLDQALVQLVRGGRISAESALATAADPEDMRIELLR